MGVMGIVGVVGLVLLAIYLLGYAVSVWAMVVLWRRSADVNLVAFMMISVISLGSWLSAIIAIVYLAGGKVLFPKKEPPTPGAS